MFNSLFFLAHNRSINSSCSILLLFSTLLMPTVYAAETLPAMTTVATNLVVMKEGKETFIPVTKAGPGDVIKYDITYKNGGNAPLSGGVVEGFIPNGATYIADSASNNLSNPATAKLEVSIDGGTQWVTPPVYHMVKQADGSMKKMEVSPSEYKKLRWILSEPVLAQQHNVFTYWVKVPDLAKNN